MNAPLDLMIPPHSLESEQSVLGGLLLSNSAWDKVCELVAEKDFYTSAHRRIFRAIESLIGAGKEADIVTVSVVLGDDLKDIGGLVYLGSLVQNTPSVHNINRYAEVVLDRSQKRQLIAVASDMLDSLYHAQNATAAELMGRASEKIFALERVAVKKGRSFSKVLSDVLASVDSRYHASAEITGLPTGFIDLDEMTAGLQNEDLIIIAGRPSMGKTALAMNIAEHVALNEKKAVAVFSLEMSDTQLAQRMIGSVGRVNQHRLRTGRLSDDDWSVLSSTVGKLHDANILIEETFDLAPAQMRAKARRIKRENPDLGLIVVDYLQLMEAGGNNRADQIADITRGLKRIAKELQIPVVALSQLNRGLEQRTNKRPVMSDLRESGAIEQDADVIIFLYRDKVYNEDTLNPNLAEAIIGKQRNGPIGTVNLHFEAQFARFDNWSGEVLRSDPKPKNRAFDSYSYANR